MVNIQDLPDNEREIAFDSMYDAQANIERQEIDGDYDPTIDEVDEPWERDEQDD